MKNRFTSTSPWCRVLGPVVLFLAAAILPSRGQDNASGLPPAQRSVITVGVDPTPVDGVQNLLTGVVSAAYMVQIREIGGLGGEVLFINSTVFDPETGEQKASTFFDNAALKVFVGESRIEPNGELDVAQTVSYALPEGRVEADLTVAVQIQDDRGSVVNHTILVPIVPPPVEE